MPLRHSDSSAPHRGPEEEDSAFEGLIRLQRRVGEERFNQAFEELLADLARDEDAEESLEACISRVRRWAGSARAETPTPPQSLLDWYQQTFRCTWEQAVRWSRREITRLQIGMVPAYGSPSTTDARVELRTVPVFVGDEERPDVSVTIRKEGREVRAKLTLASPEAERLVEKHPVIVYCLEAGDSVPGTFEIHLEERDRFVLLGIYSSEEWSARIVPE